MSKAITKNELVKLNSELSAKVAALGTQVVDLQAKIARLETKAAIKSAPVSPGKIAAAQQLADSKATVAELIAQYGNTNVMRKGAEYLVRTPNGAWHPVA